MNCWFMRKLFIIAFSVLLLNACYDDSSVRSDIEEMKSRIERLEKMCELMNDEIQSVQSVVDAIENRDYVTSYERLSDGYMIKFASGKIWLSVMVRMAQMEWMVKMDMPLRYR